MTQENATRVRFRNSPESFGAIAKLFHWTTAALFIGAYLLVYYALWILGDEHSNFPPVLKLHFACGLLVGFLVLPRIVWRLLNVQPPPLGGDPIEHRLAELAHFGLYGLMILMPVTGYIGTSVPSSIGPFELPSFKTTGAFAWIADMLDVTWKEFEEPVDMVHHFVGKWIAWLIVLMHVAAALYHHYVRKDDVLKRMFPMGIVRKF